MTTKYGKAGYPGQLIKSIIQDFTVSFNEKESLIILPIFFFDVKKFLFSISKQLIKKFHQFT